MKCLTGGKRIVLLVSVMLLVGGAIQPAEAVTTVTRYVFGCGGGLATATGSSLVATIGQDVIGYAGTHEIYIRSGFWHGGTATTDVDEPEMVLPVRFALAQITPNPFTPSTTIRYDVPAAGGFIKIDVFSVSGRRVNTLVNEKKSPGRHRIAWDGRTDLGKPVGAGVYFVAMQAPNYRKTQRVICIR